MEIRKFPTATANRSCAINLGEMLGSSSFALPLDDGLRKSKTFLSSTYSYIALKSIGPAKARQMDSQTTVSTAVASRAHRSRIQYVANQIRLHGRGQDITSGITSLLALGILRQSARLGRTN